MDGKNKIETGNSEMPGSLNNAPLSFWRGVLARSQSRKAFLISGLGLTAIGAFFSWKKKPEKISTVKFLTQDGKLVEIDAGKLPVAKRVASQSDVQNWIKK